MHVVVMALNYNLCLLPMQSQGVNILFVSFRWMDQEPTPGVFEFRVMDYVQQAVCSSGLQLIVILDARASPVWVFDQHPDAGLVDADGDVQGDFFFTWRRNACMARGSAGPAGSSERFVRSLLVANLQQPV
jgi:beta-galactosidase GanA